jgi:tetratricopeptide (TPR) repeat protein
MVGFFSKNKFKICAGLIILLMAFIIRMSFPPLNEYYYGADEGHYLTFANAVKNNGFFQGMYSSATVYANTPNSFIWPNPLRVFYIFLSSIFIRFADGMTGLSYLSMFSYILLLIFSYRFVEKYFSSLSALLFTALLAISPLGLDMSCRALMDATTYLMIVVSTITFVNYLASPGKLRLFIFILIYLLSILTKEINVILFPFFLIVWGYRYYKKESNLRITDLAIIIVTIPVAAFLAYITVLGKNNFFGILNALSNSTKITEVHKYYAIFNRGPWYKYIIDFTILSPYVLLLSFFLAGVYLNNPSKNKICLAFCSFILLGYLIIICIVAKNVRYVMPCDWLLRLMIALGLPVMLDKFKVFTRIRKLTMVLFIFTLGWMDVTTFYYFFIVKKIYDPVNYMLLDAGGVLPAWNYSSEIKDNGPPSINSPDRKTAAVAYVNQGMEYYWKGKYDLCIESTQKSLILDSTSATAWNNLCAAYNSLKQWDDAIKAGNKALQIKPDFDLARNNVKFALSQKNK